MAKTKAERLSLLLSALRDMNTPTSADDAIEAMRRVVDQIEDEHSGLPYEAEMGNHDQRLYGPREDNTKRFGHVTTVRTTGNRIYIWNDGGFVIMRLTGEIDVCNMHQNRSASKGF